MKVTLGKEGCKKSWQQHFKEEILCHYCGGKADLAFVAHELIDNDDPAETWVYELHIASGPTTLWPHDACAVAVYLCRSCLAPTAEFNQA